MQMKVLTVSIFWLQADRIIPENRPSAGWPTTGQVHLYNFCLRYRENLNLVLEEINCQIKHGEKVCTDT